MDILVQVFPVKFEKSVIRSNMVGQKSVIRSNMVGQKLVIRSNMVGQVLSLY